MPVDAAHTFLAADIVALFALEVKVLSKIKDFTGSFTLSLSLRLWIHLNQIITIIRALLKLICRLGFRSTVTLTHNNLIGSAL